MGAVAGADPNTIRQTVASLGDDTYVVRLGGDDFYRVDADLPTRSRASWTPIYAGLGVDDSLWVAIVEKAYTHHRTGADTYESIESGGGSEGLTGMNATDVGRSSFSSYSGGTAVMSAIANKFERGQAVTVGISTPASGSALHARHAYTVVGVTRNAIGKVVSVDLRNPWGWDPSGAVTLTVTADDFSGLAVGSVAWGDVG
jgi:hypothetical protein